jgi:hypothetical protein
MVSTHRRRFSYRPEFGLVSLLTSGLRLPHAFHYFGLFYTYLSGVLKLPSLISSPAFLNGYTIQYSNVEVPPCRIVESILKRIMEAQRIPHASASSSTLYHTIR